MQTKPDHVSSKIVVACTNSNGEPDLFFFIMNNIPEEKYQDGFHYDAAKDVARDEDYDGEMVVFDEADMSASLESIFVWESASVVDFKY